MIISMKINWGHKLVFFAASFMLFVMFMVYRISTQKVDLVDQNYYENGVAYQASINKFRAAQALSPQINFQLQNQQIEFTCNAAVEGTVTFYRPSDASKDFKVEFKTLNNQAYVFSTSRLDKGLWNVTYEWRYNNTLMAAEKQIMVE